MVAPMPLLAWRALSVAVQDLRNNNTELVIDYRQLTVSTSFTPTMYQYDALSEAFSLNSTTALPDGGSFTLTETISWNELVVLEDVVINGVHVLPYSTPILYQRI